MHENIKTGRKNDETSIASVEQEATLKEATEYRERIRGRINQEFDDAKERMGILQRRLESAFSPARDIVAGWCLSNPSTESIHLVADVERDFTTAVLAGDEMNALYEQCRAKLLRTWEGVTAEDYVTNALLASAMEASLSEIMSTVKDRERAITEKVESVEAQFAHLARDVTNTPLRRV